MIARTGFQVYVLMKNWVFNSKCITVHTSSLLLRLLSVLEEYNKENLSFKRIDEMPKDPPTLVMFLVPYTVPPVK